MDRALALDPGFAPAIGLRARVRARVGDVRRALRPEAFLATRPSPGDSIELRHELQAVGAIR